GAAVARGEVVVFLNNDTVPVGRWLTEMLAGFSDPGVVGVGPRSNFVSGPQLCAEARYTKVSELRSFERAWRADHAGVMTDMDRLVGFCVAVRREAFEAAGGFDESYGIGGYEDDDLCRRLRAAGGRLVMADAAFVHHEGHATFDANHLDWAAIEVANRDRFLSGTPFVSACLIVRDEQDCIERCLASLDGLVDEIVVADTGSVDRTVELATAAGARVVRVPWTDHFAEARNAALAHCRGRWVAWIDADEEWAGDSSAVRSHLATTTDDGVLVSITNRFGEGVEATSTHPAVRIFRSGLAWRGRVHEQVVRPDGANLVATLVPAAALTHHGYVNRVMGAKDKFGRNLALAAAALAEADDPREVSRAELDYGRTVMSLGRADEALEHLSKAAESDRLPLVRMALHAAVRAAMSAKGAEPREFLDRLRAVSDNPLLPDLLEIDVLWSEGRDEDLVALAARIPLPGWDEDHFQHFPSEIATRLAATHRRQGRPGDAFEALVGPLWSEGVLEEHLTTLAGDAHQAGIPLSRVGAAFPKGRLRPFLAQVLQLDDTADALAVLEGTWAANDGDLSVLAAAGLVAAKATPQAALVWARRLRDRGIGPCPVLQMAGDRARPIPDRVLAAAAVKAAFSDPAADRILVDLVAGLSPDQVDQVRPILDQLAPGMTDGISATPARTRSRREVSIVIPCWNRADMTLRCLQSLAGTLDAGRAEIVLVDNGSTDATARVSPDPDNAVVVVRNDSNRGFAVASNQGAAAAGAEVLVFCNNDIVAQPGWLDPLVGALDDPRVGAAGPKLLFPDGTIQHAGVGMFVNADGMGLLDGVPLFYRQRADHPQAGEAAELRAVTGAVLAMRAGDFSDLGGFDEGYWNGYEDVDLCLRVGEAGMVVRYEPASVLTHHESASGPERYSAVAPNRQRLTRRWMGKVTDERTHDGVMVVAPFGRGDRADGAGRQLVALAEAAEVAVVTRAWPTRGGEPFAHRLGPWQRLVLCPDEMDQGAQDGLAGPGRAVRVVAGQDALDLAGGSVTDLVELLNKSASRVENSG
ncbi:MAG: glycosyltransferase, partial [Acidimicrobiales bacterium]